MDGLTRGTKRDDVRREWLADRGAGLLGAAFVLLVGCGGSDDASPDVVPPAPPSSVTATIGAAGGTLNGPDGLQVVVPPGALEKDTAIQVARVSAGSPVALTDYTAGSPIYAVTPHDLEFKLPVTFRMPYVPQNGGVTSDVLMASPGGNWQQTEAVFANGVAEWKRASFSYIYAGTCFRRNVNDPYECSRPAMQAGFPVGSPVTNVWSITGYTRWAQTQAAALTFNLNYSAAPDCAEPRLQVVRRNFSAGQSAPQPIVLFDQTVGLGPDTPTRFKGTTTLTLDVGFADNGTVHLVSEFSCQRLGKERASVKLRDWIEVAIPQPPAAPTISQQPADVTVVNGGTAAFTISATGPDALSLAWQQSSDGGQTWTALPDTGPTLSVPGVALADSGKGYRVRVCNTLNAVSNCINSAIAWLTVKPVVQAAWSAPALVADGNLSAPAAAIDDEGKAVAVYVTNAGRIVASRGRVGSPWSGFTSIDAGINGYLGGFSPRVASNASGDTVAAWGYQSAGGWGVAAVRGSTLGGWSTPVSVSSVFTGDAIALAIDDFGRAVLVYEVSGKVYATFSEKGGSGWSSPIDLVNIANGSGGGLPAVAVNSRGEGFIVYQEGGNSIVAVQLSLGGGTPVGTALRITGSSVADPRIAVDENGGAVLAYFASATRNWEVWARTYTRTGGWSQPAVLDDDSGFDRTLAVSSDGSGNAVVAWKKQVQTAVSNASFYDTVHASRYAVGQGWSPRQMLSAPEADGVQAIQTGASRGGRMVVSWVQDDPDFISRSHARVYESGWGAPSRVQVSSNYGGVGYDPLSHNSLAVSPNTGEAVLLWFETIENGVVPRPNPVFGSYLR